MKGNNQFFTVLAPAGAFLYEIEFIRWVAVPIDHPWMKRIPFRDETGKYTVAKWRLKDYRPVTKIGIFRLDARSIRYMRRTKIRENKRPFRVGSDTTANPAYTFPISDTNQVDG